MDENFVGLVLLRTLKPADLPVEHKYVIKKEIELVTKISSLKADIHLLKLSGFILFLCDLLSRCYLNRIIQF